MGPGRTETETCTPTPSGTVYFGTLTIQNDQAEPATIDSITVGSPTGLELAATYLVPTSSWGKGLGSSVNPAKDADKQWRWDQRIPAVGAVITDRSPIYDLVNQVSLQRGVEQGRSSGVFVHYRMADRNYVASYPASYRLVRDKC